MANSIQTAGASTHDSVWPQNGPSMRRGGASQVAANASAAAIGPANDATSAKTPAAVTSSATVVLVAYTARAVVVLAIASGSSRWCSRPWSVNTYAERAG